MKRVARKGVFETNSSSSHSLTLKRVKTNDTGIEKDASFEIRSPLAKTVQMLGLISNAERQFKSTAMYIDEDNPNNKVKNDIVNILKENAPEVLSGVNVDNISTYDLGVLIAPIASSFGSLTLDYFYQLNDNVFSVFYKVDCTCRAAVQCFKNKLFDALCKINNWTMDQAQREIDFQAFANIEIRDILKDESTAKEKLLANMKYNFKFKTEFEKSGSNDVVAFAKEYLIKDCYEFKQQVNGRISCEIYFRNGCLDECYCGFEDYYEIERAFGISCYMSDDEIEQKAIEFLSNEYKIVATEKYCGVYLEKIGEIL